LPSTDTVTPPICPAAPCSVGSFGAVANGYPPAHPGPQKRYYTSSLLFIFIFVTPLQLLAPGSRRCPGTTSPGHPARHAQGSPLCQHFSGLLLRGGAVLNAGRGMGLWACDLNLLCPLRWTFSPSHFSYRALFGGAVAGVGPDRCVCSVALCRVLRVAATPPLTPHLDFTCHILFPHFTRMYLPP